MFESIILGITQGVFEWLPISSEGAIVFLEANFFHQLGELSNIIQYALLLHLGTALAAIIYLWNDIVRLFKSIFAHDPNNPHTKGELRFLALATLISGILGLALLQGIIYFENIVPIASQGITVAVGVLLLATGYIQIKARKTRKERKDSAALTWRDDVLVGIAQGLAVLPGLSRSALTVSTLMLRGYDDKEAFRLSFLLSIPIVLLGNIFLNIKDFTLTTNSLVAIFFSFVFGLLTIHILLKLAERYPFGPIAVFFGVLVLLSAFFG
ncbi:MAG: undecaprenyl-diphosphate phosphatase [Parcubacteria group bacterium]|nr:undecaprenyl-diphosphate phosphatase [Parcubacteria group bacterium]